jgi:hypothetical protein
VFQAYNKYENYRRTKVNMASPVRSLCKVALAIAKFRLTPKLDLSVFRKDTLEKWPWFVFTALVVFGFVLPVTLVCPSLLMHVRKCTVPHFTIRTGH